MNPKQAEKELLEISKDHVKIEEYNEYWGSITPTTDEEIFRRYVFSFLSVHTSWSSNVSSFLLLDRHKEVYNSREEVIDLIRESKAGFQETKGKGIHKFYNEFYANPSFFLLKDDVNDQERRDTIMKNCFNLGFAKTAFALEMCFPLQAQVVCLDTHMLQLYGYTDKDERAKAGQSKKKYYEVENHWLAFCKELNIAPAIARALWWDKKQQREDSRYWTYVIE